MTSEQMWMRPAAGDPSTRINVTTKSEVWSLRLNSWNSNYWIFSETGLRNWSPKQQYLAFLKLIWLSRWWSIPALLSDLVAGYVATYISKAWLLVLRIAPAFGFICWSTTLLIGISRPSYSFRFSIPYYLSPLIVPVDFSSLPSSRCLIWCLAT